MATLLQITNRPNRLSIQQLNQKTGEKPPKVRTNALDYSAVKLRLEQIPDDSTAPYDVNCDGDITALDYSSIKLNLGVSLPSCP